MNKKIKELNRNIKTLKLYISFAEQHGNTIEVKMKNYIKKEIIKCEKEIERLKELTNESTRNI